MWGCTGARVAVVGSRIRVGGRAWVGGGATGARVVVMGSGIRARGWMVPTRSGTEGASIVTPGVFAAVTVVVACFWALMLRVGRRSSGLVVCAVSGGVLGVDVGIARVSIARAGMFHVPATVLVARVLDWGAIDWDKGCGRIGSSRRRVCSHEWMGGPGWVDFCVNWLGRSFDGGGSCRGVLICGRGCSGCGYGCAGCCFGSRGVTISFAVRGVYANFSHRVPVAAKTVWLGWVWTVPFGGGTKVWSLIVTFLAAFVNGRARDGIVG